ncbi:MAG: creatininase family protein [Acidimicrobiales bacterium]
MPRDVDRHLERLAQPVAERMLAGGTAVLVAGSVEQHGGHLPLGTDAFAAMSIAERVAARLDTAVVSLGAVGIAHYHLGWPGTLSLAPSTLKAVMMDVCGSLVGAGVRRIVLVNWHEGNSPTLRLAADEAQRAHGLKIVIAEAHVITHSSFPEEMEFTHAGSMETAAVLAYEPELVHLDRMIEASDGAAGERAHGLFRRPDVYPVMSDFHHVAATGWYGRPELADVTRAEQIAEHVADHVVRRAREIWLALEAAEPGGSMPASAGADGAAVGGSR